MIGATVDSESMAAEPSNAVKRKASTAFCESGQNRSVKRRASKACQCCRARKVRCNVVEHGAPCTNCRLDDIECIVTESKRKRKVLPENGEDRSLASLSRRINGDPVRRTSFRESLTANSDSYHSDGSRQEEHIPHPLYRNHTHRVSSAEVPPPVLLAGLTVASLPNVFGQKTTFDDSQVGENIKMSPESQGTPTRPIPLWARDFAPRVDQDDIAFLKRKMALDIPDKTLRNELLRCFIEFVYPYMPLFDLGDFLQSIESGNGSKGKISLLVFQAVMFTGVAMVDIVHLRRAGYPSRREARKSFYQRARLLYDFDTESDRITLMQALLLLTFWYERPDDEKDTWHWIGVATSLAYTIGLNRNPLKSNASAKTQRLWKRIWWSCVIRDRVISMGVRRPTRIKAEECDVPMLTLEDFDLSPLPQDVACVPRSCSLARDPEMLRTVALMCIEQAKFCFLISRVFTAQYSIPAQDSRGDTIVESGTATTLVPRQVDPASSEVRACHEELQEWVRHLPKEVDRETLLSKPVTRATAPVIVNGSMLHLIYLTTLHALHRPQTGNSGSHARDASHDELIALSEENVKIATRDSTSIFRKLLKTDCARFLPTAGVTTLMPASVTNLVDIKSSDPVIRTAALEGFYQCAQALNRLRDCYASADHSMFMLEKAVRKAGLEVPLDHEKSLAPSSIVIDTMGGATSSSPSPPSFVVTSIDQLLDFCVRQGIVAPAVVPAPGPFVVPAYNPNNALHHSTTTPPPDDIHDLRSISLTQALQHDSDVASRLSAYLATTPPDSKHDNTSHLSHHYSDDPPTANDETDFTSTYAYHDEATINHDFDSLINADSLGGIFYDTNDASFLGADGVPMYSAAGGLYSSGATGLQFQGESSGFTFDMDWMHSPPVHDTFVVQTQEKPVIVDEQQHQHGGDGGADDELVECKVEPGANGIGLDEELELALAHQAHVEGAGILIEDAVGGKEEE